LCVHGNGFRRALFWDILRVGVVAAFITVGANLTIAIATGLVGRFGPAAIAGYGTGSRLEYLLIPLVFGLGGPLVAMVGTNMGAGQRERALHAAWIGAAIAAGLCQTIGLCAALTPGEWLALFDRDPANIEARSRYLQTVGPFYGQFGLGMALYFASQGAGRLLWPLIANVGRLVVASGGGRLVLQLGGAITHLERAGWKLRDVERIEINEAFGRSLWPRNLACPRTSSMSMAAPSPMAIRSAPPAPCLRRDCCMPCVATAFAAASSRSASVVARASRWRLKQFNSNAWDPIHSSCPRTARAGEA
jgi:MatE